MKEQMRAEFESWADKELFALDRSEINSELYRNNLTRNAWEGWKAAATNLEEKMLSVGYKLVPTAELSAVPSMRKAKPLSDADRELLKNEFYFANDGKERDWSEQETQAQQPAQEQTCQQCGVRSGNGHCLGDI